MLQDGGPLATEFGYIPAVVYIITKTVLAIGLWGAAVIGFLGTSLTWPQRVLGLAAAFTLVAALPMTDAIGFALTALFAGWVWLSLRGARQASGAG